MSDPHILIKTDKATGESQIIGQGSEEFVREKALEKAREEGDSFGHNRETGDTRTRDSVYEVFDKNDLR